MSHHDWSLDRRHVLWQLGGGLGGIALTHLLGRDTMLAETPATARSEQAGGIRLPATAIRVLQLFTRVVASQFDTFDYKPELTRQHGEKFDPGERVELFQSDPGACMKSPWSWRQYGECGKWLNECVAPLGACVD